MRLIFRINYYYLIQVSRLRKAFGKNSSDIIKLSKTQLSKIGVQLGVQLGVFLGRPLGPLAKNGLSLMKNVLQASAKSVLIPLGLTAAASATDTAILNR